MQTPQLDLAERGFSVFPIIPNTKRPLTAHGLNDATTNAEQIEKWTNDNPTANWAIRTDGLLVVDIDPTPEGVTPWLANEPDKLLDLAAAPMATTPRGGRHYLFRQPAGANLRNTQSELAPGVDTRATGGYVLVAPSSVGGKSYRWVDGEPESPAALPEPPQWLLDTLTKKQTPTWQATAPGKIAEGKRNASLFKFGCSMRRPGMSQDEITAALKVRNLARCNPPLEDREVERIAQSCANYEADAGTVAKIDGKPKQLTKLLMVRMSDVEEKETEWLWENHIPIGELTCVGGYQGQGKSVLTMDIAARVTTGKPWPGSDVGYEGGGDVIVFSAEDDIARTIKPRLRAAGADMDRVHAIQGVKYLDEDTECDFSLERDLPALEQAIEQTNNCKLIVLDPISCFTGDVDEHVNKEVRRVLKPLRDLAEKHRVAIIFVTHLNRSEAKNALNRISGSGAFTSAPRMAWIVAEDKEDGAYRVLVQLKNNLCVNPGALVFRIVDCLIDGKTRPRVEYEKARKNITASEALDESGDKKQRGSSALDDCVAWLSSYMTGPKPAKEALEAGEAEGHSERTIIRARQVLNVKPRQNRDGEKMFWEWYIPLAVDDQQVANTSPADPVHIVGMVGNLAA